LAAACTGQQERERRRTVQAGRRRRVTAARGSLVLAGMVNEPPAALVGLMIAQAGITLELLYVHN